MNKKSFIKNLLLLIFLAINFTACRAQFVPYESGQFRLLAADTLYNLTGCGEPTFHPNFYKRVVTYFDSCTGIPYWHNPKTQTWITVRAADADSLFNDAITTNNTQIAYDPGDNLTPYEWIKKVFYGIMAPTASISGGSTLELTGSATVARTLNWTSGRQANSDIITSIVVGGTTQSFSQPGQSSTVSGTQNVNVPANTTTTYNNITTSADGQIASAATTFTYSPRMYYGWISDTTGINSGTQDAVIRALADQPLTTSKDLIFNRPISGTQYFVVGFPSSQGTLSTITFNGFESLDAMNTGTHNFTNGQAFTQSYRFYWNKLAQNATSTIIAH